MRTIRLEIQNENIVDKLLWMLSHFKNDGVTIREDSIESSIKNSVDEMNEIKKGNLKARDIDELLNEL